MMDVSTPLNDEELDWLDAFLLDRIDEDAVYEDDLEKDEGVLDISELDGFFTALVSGPVTILPSRWLPAVGGITRRSGRTRKISRRFFPC